MSTDAAGAARPMDGRLMHYPDIPAIAPEPAEFAYDDRFTMLYALGLGCGVDDGDLRFVYEQDLRALPTMAVLMGGPAGEFIKRGGIDEAMIVHGEQRLAVHRPLPPAGRMTVAARCLGVVDKGAAKGAVVHVESSVSGADGMPYATAVMSLFCRGDGGFGGPAEDQLTLAPVPDRAPDCEVAITTLPQQAAIYRLSPDGNPAASNPPSRSGSAFPGRSSTACAPMESPAARSCAPAPAAIPRGSAASTRASRRRSFRARR